MNEILTNLDVGEIQQYQQNRYPLLFVDKITESKPGEYAKGYKNFTYNEWFFPAHFADEPNVPGFVQIEALTQVFLMSFLTLDEFKGKKTGFVEVRKARFSETHSRRPSGHRSLSAFLQARACRRKSNRNCKRRKACEAEFLIAVPDELNKYMPKRKENHGTDC